MTAARAAYGLDVTGIYRLVDDPTTVLLTLEVADLESAKRFARSDVLNTGRARALAGGRAAADVWFSDNRMLVD